MRFLLFLLIALVFFVRGDVFDDVLSFSVTFFIPPVATALIFATYIKNNFSFPKPPAYIILAAYFIVINGLFSAYLTDDLGLSILYIVEYFVSFLVYYAVFMYLRNKGSANDIYKDLLIGSFVGTIPIIMLSTYQDTIRRIGTGETDLPVSVNHIGPSLAVVSIVFLFFIINAFKEKHNIYTRIFLLFGFVITVLGTILTGSKTAVGGIVLTLLFIALLDRRYRVYIIIISILLALSLYYYATNSDNKYSALITRFTLERIELGFEQRFGSLDAATQGMKPQDVIIGQGWRYEPNNSKNPIHYPHNFLISNLFHSGVIPLLILLYAFIKHYYHLLKMMLFKNNNKSRYYLTFACYNITFIAIMFSGRITRIITVFVFFALTDWLIETEKKLKAGESISQ